jgi:hypothetical protein
VEMPNKSPPRLYKYLDVNGALLTLRNRTFKHSKPSELNDQADLTIESLFPEADESAMAAVWTNLTDVVVKNIDRPPTCLDETLRNQVIQLQSAFRQNPAAAELIKAEVQKVPLSDIYDLEKMKERGVSHVKEINDFMRQFRILCVSEIPNSMRMWSRYAQRHEGVVLGIQPNLQKDSKLSLFRAVKYQEKRPPLHDDPISFLEFGLFGDRNEQSNMLMDKLIYAKTLEWEYEREQRLAIPILDGADWDVMPYHPEEITEVYLGAKMNDTVRNEIIALAIALNPKVGVFQAVKGSSVISFYLVR